MDESRFIFGVDLDGVCADLYGKMREIAAEWLGRPLESLPAEVSYGLAEWGLEEYGGYEKLHRFAVTQRNLFKELKPLPDAPQVLRKLSTRGVRIRIITHRLYIHWFHKEAIRQTTEWLERHGVPYWDLCFMRDKAAVGADLYLEDSPDNIRALRATGHETIVVVNSTNRELPPPRATDWDGIERLVRERVALWRQQG